MDLSDLLPKSTSIELRYKSSLNLLNKTFFNIYWIHTKDCDTIWKRRPLSSAQDSWYGCSSPPRQRWFEVTVLEKNDQPGGRAIVWKEKDLFSTWVLLGILCGCVREILCRIWEKTTGLLQASSVESSIPGVFSKDEIVDVSPTLEHNLELFERYQKDGREQFKKYLTAAEYQYKIAMNEFIYKEYRHLWNFFSFRLLSKGSKLHLFTSLDEYAKRYITDPKMRKS